MGFLTVSTAASRDLSNYLAHLITNKINQIKTTTTFNVRSGMNHQEHQERSDLNQKIIHLQLQPILTPLIPPTSFLCHPSKFQTASQAGRGSRRSSLRNTRDEGSEETIPCPLPVRIHLEEQKRVSCQKTHDLTQFLTVT